MNKKRGTIYNLFETAEGIEIVEDPLKSKIRLKLKNEIPKYDPELEERINQTWKNHLLVKPSDFDSVNPFMGSVLPKIDKNNLLQLDVAQGRYRDSVFFSRKPKNYQELEKLASQGIFTPIHIGTHYHIMTKDGYYAIFGEKTNQKVEGKKIGQMSGYGGFINLNEYVNETTTGKYLNLHKFILDNAVDELGPNISDSISSIEVIGSTYVSRPGLSGSDLNFLVYIDMSAQDLMNTFQISDQFAKKNLVKVEFNPISMSEFVMETFEKGGEVSPYALGCQSILMQNRFERSERDVYFDTLNKLDINYRSEMPEFIRKGLESKN